MAACGSSNPYSALPHQIRHAPRKHIAEEDSTDGVMNRKAGNSNNICPTVAVLPVPS